VVALGLIHIKLRERTADCRSMFCAANWPLFFC
jgi:hypothetical protein